MLHGGKPLLRRGPPSASYKDWLPWCLDTLGTKRHCFQQASPRAWAPSATIVPVFRHPEGEWRGAHSSGVGTKYEQVGFGQEKSSSPSSYDEARLRARRLNTSRPQGTSKVLSKSSSTKARGNGEDS